MKKDEGDLRNRTKAFALRVIRLFVTLPKSTEAQVLGRQVLRSGTSVGANYRAACRARSKADFASKMGIVLEEADEAISWAELLSESGVVPKDAVEPLIAEANQLVSIAIASIKTAKGI